MTSIDTLVVGAGPAGLATSASLSRAGVPHAVLERGQRAGETWANLYDSLVLHTAKRLSALPGLPFPPSTPTFPSREDFLGYLESYAATFRVPLATGSEVARLDRQDGTWVATTTAGRRLTARSVVVATGIAANPYLPDVPGRAAFRGQVMHSRDYRRPASVAGHRVLVAGAGNSAGEIAAELASAGAEVTLSVRSGAMVVPRDIAGISLQYFTIFLGALPPSAQRATATAIRRVSALVRGPSGLPDPPLKACPQVPIVGFHLVEAIRAKRVRVRGGIDTFTMHGVRFLDGTEQPFDAVLLATGYRAALGLLDGLIQIDACGFAQRRDRVTSCDQPNLYFVGHNYGIQGGLFNIGRDAKSVARRIAATNHPIA